MSDAISHLQRPNGLRLSDADGVRCMRGLGGGVSNDTHATVLNPAGHPEATEYSTTAIRTATSNTTTEAVNHLTVLRYSFGSLSSRRSDRTIAMTCSTTARPIALSICPGPRNPRSGGTPARNPRQLRSP